MEINTEETFDFLKEDKSKILKLTKALFRSPKEEDINLNNEGNFDNEILNFKYEPVLGKKYKEDLEGLSRNEFIKRLTIQDINSIKKHLSTKRITEKDPMEKSENK